MCGYLCYSPPPTKFKEEERKIIFNYLEKIYEEEIKADLTELSTNLIEGKNFLTTLTDKIKKLFQEQNLIKKKKKIFLLGETGVGKSTLINCIEDKMIALESKCDAPTTMEYKEYVSCKYPNYILCDTRGIEKKNFAQIEEMNIELISNNIKDCFYLFWFLKGSSSNFQDTDAKFIKSLETKIKVKIPLFFIITKSTDEEGDKKRLNTTINEYFPYIKNIPIFPLYARGTKRMPAFGLNELIDETKNYFGKKIIEETFKTIYEKDKIYNINFSDCLEECDIKNLFVVILNYIRLEESENKINNGEKILIDNFIEKHYSKFDDNSVSINNSYFNEIFDLCSLVKAKYKIIDINKFDKISNNLTNINNNSINDDYLGINNENNSSEDEILEGDLNLKKKKSCQKLKNILKTILL